MPRETNIQIRRGSAADWSSVNPTLAAGELAMENDTRKVKVGDGSTAWNSLRYMSLDGGDIGGGGGGGGGDNSCPAPHMRILLADGALVPAGELAVGMFVRTRHETTMEEGSYEVSHVSVVEAARLSLRIGEVNFVCSFSHKFLVGGGWVSADSLKVGDEVGGSLVHSVEEIGVGEVVKITVEGAHTYVCEGFLSHNKSGEIQPTATPVPPTATPVPPTATPAPSGQPDPVLLATFDGNLLLDQGPNNFWLESSLWGQPDYGSIETASNIYAPFAPNGAVAVGVIYGTPESLGVRTDVGRANLGALISGGSFTVEMWYYPGDALSAVYGYGYGEEYFKIGPYVVAGIKANEYNADYGAPTYAYTGVYGIGWSQPGSELCLSATLLTPQAWNHAALVVDASEVRLYINGSLACTGPLSSNLWVNEFQVGGFFGNEFSSGVLSAADDVRITASAIYSGSTISPPTRGTLTYSRTTNATTELLLNATHGIEDWGKNKIALRYEDYFNAQSRSAFGSGPGPVVSTTEKKFGVGSYYMDGTVGGLHLVDITYGSGQAAAMAPLTDAIQDGPWTLEMWVRPTATLSYNATPIGDPEQSGEAYFTLGFAENEYIALYDNTYSGPRKGTLIIDGEEYPDSWLTPDTISSGVTLEYRVGGVSQWVNLPTSLSRNAWHHLAVVADTAAGLLRLKVDGSQVGTIDISGSWASKGAGFSGIDGLAIGELSNHVAGPGGYNANTCNWFTGYIDDIRISSVALYGTGSYTVPAAALT